MNSDQRSAISDQHQQVTISNQDAAVSLPLHLLQDDTIGLPVEVQGDGLRAVTDRTVVVANGGQGLEVDGYGAA